MVGDLKGKIELALSANPAVVRRLLRLAPPRKRATLCWCLLEIALSRLDDEDVLAALLIYEKGRKGQRGGGRKRKKNLSEESGDG
jgi:hypothetical protein